MVVTEAFTRRSQSRDRAVEVQFNNDARHKARAALSCAALAQQGDAESGRYALKLDCRAQVIVGAGAEVGAAVAEVLVAFSGASVVLIGAEVVGARVVGTDEVAATGTGEGGGLVGGTGSFDCVSVSAAETAVKEVDIVLMPSLPVCEWLTVTLLVR